jgi:hypothetical protein
MAKLIICTFLWHDDRAKCRGIYEYTRAHIRRTKWQVDKYLTIPHDFVVVTDNLETFKDDADIRAVKLDKTTFVPGTRFAKLMLWREDIGDIIGERIGYIDLDCVITRSLDPIFDRTEDVVLWRNPNYQIKKRRGRYNTSIILLDAGARPHLYDDFNPIKHPRELRKIMGGTDQAWISTQLSVTDEAYWSSDDGVYGAGRLRDIAPGVRTTLPADARIVFFPGPREPGMSEIQKIHPWIKDYFR